MDEKAVNSNKAVTESSVWLERLAAFSNPQEAAIFAGENEIADYFFHHNMGAIIYFTYNGGILRMEKGNAQYEREIKPDISFDEVGGGSEWQFSDEQEEKLFAQMLIAAEDSGQNAEGEVWFRSFSQCCGFQAFCISFRLHLVAKYQSERLFCAQIQNTTKQKHAFKSVSDSENKFRAAADHANIYAWEYDIATKVMRPCSRCMRDLGMPAVVENYPEPVIESGLFPEDYADMYRHWHKRLEQGESGMQAVIPLTKDRIPFHVRYTTEFDKDGKPVRAFGSATLAVDNEKEVQLKEIIATLTTKYATVLKIDLATDKAEALNIGEESSVAVQAHYYDDQTFSFEEILRKYIADYVHPDDKTTLLRVLDLKNIRNVLTHATAFSHTYRIIRKQKPRYMQVRIFGMTDKNKIILAIQNVDEVMSLQSQSEDKLKLDFESVKAEHDIKNALINNMADNEKDVVSIMEHLLTENDQLDAEHVKRLRINVKLLEELAVDIFEASHLEQIDDEPDKTGFEIKNLFKTVENFAQVIAGMKEIDFIVDEDFDGVSDTEVYGNMLYVKRILFNIVHNALKYSPAGSEIHCAVELREHGGRLACKYKVSDEGIGIATDFQPHMFDPFTQENRQVDSWGNGQGLGLYVAKQLLDKIGGNIAVYSAVDIGTIVTVNMSFDIV